MKRRLLAIVTTTMLAFGTAAAITPPAHAEGSCSLAVPSRVSITQPYRAITIRFGANCAAGTAHAAWDAYHPSQGWQTIALYDGASTDIWDLYDWDPVGRWQWRPDGAYSHDWLEDVYQYGPYYTDVRYGSRARVTATRSGRRVTLRTYATRYHWQSETYVGWAGARGVIQYKTPGTSAWRNLKSVASNSSGSYQFRYRTRARRDYRVVMYDAAARTIWGSSSAAVRR